MSTVRKFAEGQQVRVAKPKQLTRRISGSQGMLRQPQADDVAEVVAVANQAGNLPQQVTAEYVVDGKVVWHADFTADELVLGHEHDLYKTGDPNIPAGICDRNGEVVLGMCRRCGRAEVELSESCAPKEPA